MKIAFFCTVIFLFTINTFTQSRTITKDEYDKVFQFADTKNNADYPLIFKFKNSIIENGKTVQTITEVKESEAEERYRIKRSVLAEGRETSKYQLTVGFGNVFCSDDGVTWKSSQNECLIYAPPYRRIETESVEYTIAEKSVDGKRVKVYREYLVFAPSQSGKPKTFNEKVSTMDSRGYFMTVIETEGSLNPKTVTLIREQSWVRQAKIEPVVVPK